MKRIYLHSIIIVVFASLVFPSCKKDYLNTNPPTSISSSVVESSTQNLMVALNGVHRYLYNGSFYATQGDIGQATNIIIGDLLGEDYITTGSNWFGPLYQWKDHRNSNSSYDYFCWQFYYGIVGDVNAILGAVDKASGIDADKKVLKGESYAYRAWAYFNLVQFYSKRYTAANLNELGVILRTTAGDVAKKHRSTIGETYQRINDDLDSAMANLTGAASRSNGSHFNLNVAQGLKARVALVQQNWAVAANMANLARSSFKLMDSVQYRQGFSDYTNPEWLWGSHQGSDANSFFSSWMAYCGNFSSTHNRTCPKTINVNLWNQIPATDVRKSLFDPTGKDLSFPRPTSGSIRRKYMQRKFLIAGTTYVPSQYYTISGSSIGDVPLMRVAEMYLIEAEARAQMGDNAGAQQLLFKLVSTRDAGYVLSSNTGQALINEVLFQRRIELWGEGFRFADLKRLGMNLDRTGAKASDNSYDPGVLTIPVDDVRWMFLIPQQEIDANDQCELNPF
jgi:hypothetical protein